MVQLKLKRAYDPPAKSDGYRILVDRLWPRGISKDELRIDLWARDLAPSAALRKWYDHDPAKWGDFRKRYYREIEQHPDVLEEVRDLLRRRNVTLVFAAKDADISNAAALKGYLGRPAARRKPAAARRRPASRTSGRARK